jgi:hypothetical protein
MHKLNLFILLRYNKLMRIEIDQSWKVEDTQKPTILAFSNSKTGVIIILSREKKLIQKYFREIRKPKLFTYLSFVVLVYLLIKNNLSDNDCLVIDREYPGYEKFIKQKLNEIIIQNTKVKDISVSTEMIGKKSKAHILAYKGYKMKSKIGIKKVLAKDIIRIIKTNLKKSGST